MSTDEAPGLAAPPYRRSSSPPYDPLRLCIFATVALLGWVLGPFALLIFSSLGFIGYWKARRAGLRRSKCVLRDVRLVLGYLGALSACSVLGLYLRFN